MVSKCPLTRKENQSAGEDEKGESVWGLIGCPKTNVAYLGFGLGMQRAFSLMGGDTDYPAYIFAS